MRAPKKVIAAMAMATLIGGTGVGQAFADGFEVNSSNTAQTANVKAAPATDKVEVGGDIEINGTFNKLVTSFPIAAETGEYLRVTMPIKLDFVYDVDKDTMQSPEGKVKNESAYIQVNPTSKAVENTNYKGVKMSFVDIQASNNDGTMGDTVFVNKTMNDETSGKVELPFNVSVKRGDGVVTTYTMKDIQDAPDDNLLSVNIDPKDTVQLQLGKIEGQKLGNKDLIKQEKSLTKHNLTMRFEYMK